MPHVDTSHSRILLEFFILEWPADGVDELVHAARRALAGQRLGQLKQQVSVHRPVREAGKPLEDSMLAKRALFLEIEVVVTVAAAQHATAEAKAQRRSGHANLVGDGLLHRVDGGFRREAQHVHNWCIEVLVHNAHAQVPLHARFNFRNGVLLDVVAVQAARRRDGDPASGAREGDVLNGR